MMKKLSPILSTGALGVVLIVGCHIAKQQPPRPAEISGQPAAQELAWDMGKVITHEWDLHKSYPWLPPLLSPDKITPEMKDVMRRFTATYQQKLTSDGKGVNPREVEEFLARCHAAFPWQSDQPGPRKALSLNPKSDKSCTLSVAELTTLLAPMLRLYKHASPAQRAEVESVYRRAMQSVIASNYRPPAPLDGWIGNGYEWRRENFAGLFFGLSHTLTAAERALLAETVAYFPDTGRLLYREHPGSSTDIQYNVLGVMCTALASMDDGPVKWQRLEAMRRGVDLSLIEGENFVHVKFTGILTPDGGILHHAGHHFLYGGYSFLPILHHQINFAKAGLFSPYSVKVLGLARVAARSWAFNSLNGEVPWPLQLRPGPTWEKNRDQCRAPGYAPAYAKAVAELEVCLAGREGLTKDDEMTRPLQGHRAFPVMGVSTHRRDDWVVMLRGANTFFRGGEVYSSPDYPGGYLRRIMEGALFIYSRGKDGRPPNSVDSGFRTEGFDPNMFPNVTAAMCSNRGMTGIKGPAYMGSRAKQGGGADLDGDGVWAWDPGYVRKSAFCVGNRITLVTTGVQMKGADVRTTLLQQIHDKLSEDPLQIDGREVSGPLEVRLDGAQIHTLLDGCGTGYYLPVGSPQIVVRRGEQGYTYAIPGQAKEGVDFKKLDLSTGAKLAAVIDQFKPIVRDASVAWFEHGASPTNAQCQFTVLVRTTPDQLADFAKAMSNADAALRPMQVETSQQWHAYRDKATEERAVATFAPEQNVSWGDLRHVGRPGTMIWRKTVGDHQLEFSIASTDLSDSTSFSLVLGGKWKLKRGSDSDIVCVEAGGNTSVTVPYRNQCPRHVALVACFSSEGKLTHIQPVGADPK